MQDSKKNSNQILKQPRIHKKKAIAPLASVAVVRSLFYKLVFDFS
ncbi:hypothetical protein [Dendronalium sp. ChiSLP03b]